MSRPQAGGSGGLDIPLSECHSQGQAFRGHRPHVALVWGQWSRPHLPLPAIGSQQGTAAPASSSHNLLLFETQIQGTERSGKVSQTLAVHTTSQQSEAEKTPWSPVSCSELLDFPRGVHTGRHAPEATQPRAGNGNSDTRLALRRSVRPWLGRVEARACLVGSRGGAVGASGQEVVLRRSAKGRAGVAGMCGGSSMEVVGRLRAKGQGEGPLVVRFGLHRTVGSMLQQLR